MNASNRMMVVGLVLTAVGTAFGADYHWNGDAGDHRWSTPGNWEDASGNPVGEAPSDGASHTYNFTKCVAGEEVLQDCPVTVKELRVNKNLTVTGSAGMAFKFAADCDLVPSGVSTRLTLAVDASGDTSTGDIRITGGGRLVLDLIKPTGKERKYNLNEQFVSLELANAEAANNNFVCLNCKNTVLELACDAKVKEICYEWGESNHVGTRILLNGHRLVLGAGYDNWRTSNTFKSEIVAAGGTIAVVGGNVDNIQRLPADGFLEVKDGQSSPLSGSAVTANLTFGDLSATTLVDTFGNGSELEAYSNDAAVAPTLVDDAERGAVLYLDGATGLRGTGTDRSISQLPSGAGTAFTVAMWLKAASGCPQYAKLVYWGTPDAANKAVAFQICDAGNGKLACSLGDGAAWIDSQVAIRGGEWHHVALTYNGSAIRVFIDGVRVLNNTSMVPALDAKNLYVGLVPDAIRAAAKTWAGSDAANAFKGCLDDIMIIGRGLTDEQVEEVFQNGNACAFQFGSLRVKGSGLLALPAVQKAVGSVYATGLDGLVSTPNETFTVGAGVLPADLYFEEKTFAARLLSTGGALHLVKDGADYDLTFAGLAPNLTALTVKAGTLILSQPHAALPAPLAHWTFDEATAMGRDSSGNGFDMNFMGEGGEIVDDAAANGQALKLTGKGYLRFPTTNPTAFPTGDASYTLFARFSPDYATGNPLRWAVYWGTAGGSDVAGNGVALGSNANAPYGAAGGLALYDATGERYRSSGSKSRRFWYTAAVTYDKETGLCSLYADGALISQQTTTSSELLGWDFMIGGYYTGKAFVGLIDDVQFFDSALTQEQIDTLSHAVAYGDAEGVVRCLPACTRVTVDADASLVVDSDETLGSVTSAGSIETWAGARVSLTGRQSAAFAIGGEGTLAFAAGSTLAPSGASPWLTPGLRVTVARGASVDVSAVSVPYCVVSAASGITCEDVGAIALTGAGADCMKLKLTDNGTKLMLVKREPLVLKLK